MITRYTDIKEEYKIKRYRLSFYGMVQGVGFRYTAMHVANMYRLTGYVKNEYDGSVTCEVQGDDETIDRFVAAIRGGRFIDISGIDRKTLEIIPDERSFEVRY